MAYRKRVFLNPISLSAPSFIQAVADSSNEGTYLLGNYVLIIGDCRRNLMLDFNLANAKQRKMSLEKIDRLVKVVNEFRDAVHAEAKLIDKQDNNYGKLCTTRDSLFVEPTRRERSRADGRPCSVC